MHCKMIALLVLGGLLGDGTTAGAQPGDNLFVARPLTRPAEFTPGIEGPNCDARGNIYAVNFGRQGTIGIVTPEGRGAVYVTLPPGSVGNGIVFDRKGNLYIADYTRHNVLVIDPASRNVRIFAHESAMTQPNDLAIAPDGTIFASDPDWKNGTGRIWRVGNDGKVTLAADRQGTSNGIEVSPDAKTLYVDESDQRNVWRFTITPDRRLVGKTLIRHFDTHGFDGMRSDVDGNLYICRIGAGTVIKMTPEGKVLREVPVLGKRPSNLCFGGPDGRTVYVTEVEQTRLVQFRVDRPGLAWKRWQERD
jgi:gluconolactonase